MSNTKPRDLLSRKELQRLERDAKYEKKNVDAGLGELLKAKTGRMWMWKHLMELGLMGASLEATPNVPDGALISIYARADARRQVASRLFSMCESEFPEETQQMFWEHMEAAAMEKRLNEAREANKTNEGEGDDRAEGNE